MKKKRLTIDILELLKPNNLLNNHFLDKFVVIDEVTDKDNTTSIGGMNEVENEKIADIVHTNPLEEPNKINKHK